MLPDRWACSYGLLVGGKEEEGEIYLELRHCLEIHGFGSHLLRLNYVDRLLEGRPTSNFSNSKDGCAGASVSLSWELKRWLLLSRAQR